MLTGVIYQIRNITNDEYYVGQSQNYKRRTQAHKRELKKNIHHCIYLQNAWNKYGEENFQFEIIHDNVPFELLTDLEQQYIDVGATYNISQLAQARSILPLPKEFMQSLIDQYYTTDHTAETLAKAHNISKSITRELIYQKSYRRHNFKFPENAKEIRCDKTLNYNSYVNILTKEELGTICWLYTKNCSFTQIALKYGCGHHFISKIINSTDLSNTNNLFENVKILCDIKTKDELHYERYEIRRKDKSTKSDLQKKLISLDHNTRIGYIKWLVHNSDINNSLIWFCFGISQSTLSRIRNNKINTEIEPIECKYLIGQIKNHKYPVKNNRSANKNNKTVEHLQRNGKIKWLRNKTTPMKIAKYFKVADSTVYKLHNETMGKTIDPIPCPEILEELTAK